MDESLDISQRFAENEQQTWANLKKKGEWKAEKNSNARRTQLELTKEDTIHIYDQEGGLREISTMLTINEEDTKTYTREEWLNILKINDLENTPNFELLASLRRGIPDDL
jgi:hypothetical protein